MVLVVLMLVVGAISVTKKGRSKAKELLGKVKDRVFLNSLIMMSFVNY